jgi:hypothetical protein
VRRLKSWLRKFWSELAIGGRRREVARQLQEFLGLARPPIMASSGARGHDSNYLVADPKSIHGVLRLVNPHHKRPNPAPDMPFIFEKADARLEREWSAYARGAAAGLTPLPLWRAQDAIFCEYIPFRTLQGQLMESPERAWEILCRAAQAVQGLHAAGITHMDVCLANMLADPQLERIVFVDFEYSPAPHIDLSAQRVYDHLRLIDSTWKFIPEARRGDWDGWLKIFASAAAADISQANLTALAPALGRVLNAPVLGKKIWELSGRTQTAPAEARLLQTA